MENRNEIARNVRLGLGTGHVVLAIGLAIVLLVALRARYLPVDLTLGLVATLLAGSGAALLGGLRQAPLLARVSAAVALVAGLAFTTALIWTAAYLKGIYGDLGRGASAFFTLMVFTILPYLVVYPALALFLLRPQTGETKAEASKIEPPKAEEAKEERRPE
ncbi:MAG: hypothetical protein JXB32_20685 [Deltaproteobacteria bacterium]|nr:hypothetical protein [Deltaproteobacteria bacterium]